MSTTFAQFVQQNRQKQQSDPSYSVPFGLQQTEQPVDETAAANMAALQQEQGSSGIVDNLKNAGWGLYGAVSSFLDLGNKYVTRPGMGALYKLAAENGIPISWGNDDPEILEAIKNAESYTEAFNARFAENPWSRLLMEMVADPINLTGVGLAGKVGKLNAVRKATEASPGLARAMRQAEGIDELSGRIQALPVTAAVGAGRRVARPIDRRLGPLLGRESLLSPSKGTQLRRGDSAADIVGTEQADEALRTARNLGDDVSQFQPPPPPTPPAGATPQGGTPPAPTSPAVSEQSPQSLADMVQSRRQTPVTSTVDDVVEEVSTTPPVTSAVDDVVDEVVDAAPVSSVSDVVEAAPVEQSAPSNRPPGTEQFGNEDFPRRSYEPVRPADRVDFPETAVLDDVAFPKDLPEPTLDVQRVEGGVVRRGNANDVPQTYADHKARYLGGEKPFPLVSRLGRESSEALLSAASTRNTQLHDVMDSDPVIGRLVEIIENRPGKNLMSSYITKALSEAGFTPEELRRAIDLLEEDRFSNTYTHTLLGKIRKDYNVDYDGILDASTYLGGTRTKNVLAALNGELNARVARESGSQLADVAGRQVDEVVDGVVPPPSGDLPPISGGQSTTPSGTPQTQAPPPTISNLSVDTTVKDAVAQIAGVQNVAQSRAATEVASMITRQTENNPEWFQALELTDNPVLRGHIEAALNATDTATRELHISNLLKEMGDIGGSFGVVVPRAVKWVYDLVPAAKGRQPKKRLHLTPDDLSTGLAPRHRQALERLFADENVQKFQQRYDQFRDIVTDIGNSVPGGRQINDMSTVEDLIYNKNLVTDPRQKKIVEDFLETFDLPSEANLVQMYDRGVMRSYERSLMKQLGIKYPEKEVASVTRRFARWMPKAWREQALLSPRYHLQNGADMGLKSQFYGVNWVKSAKAAPTLLDNLGMTEYPRGVDVVSDLAEFATPDEPTALGAIPVAGRVGGWLARNNRHISRWMDNSARRAAWAQQTRDSLTQGMPRIQTRLRELGRQSNLQVNDLLSDLKNMGVEFSPQQMYEVALNRTGSEEFATQARNLWAQTVQAASDQGVELATKIHYDYAYETVLEEALQVRHWVGFHIWATRNIPFYLDTLATHPMALRIWEDWYSTSKQEIEDSNLTSRFDNTLPLTIPILGPILSSIMGPGQTYFNPLVIMSLADQFDPRFEQQNPSTLASIFKYTGMAGISPAPWIQYPLSATGLLGDSTSAPRLGRHTGLIEGATGVNIEKPIQDFHDEVLERMGGDPKRPITNDPYTDYLVLKRIQEMSVEQTGVPNHPQYVQAMSDPESPIFQEALQQAQRTKLGGALYNFISPVPMKHLPTTEAAVRQRESELPPFEERDLESLPDNDLSTTYWGRPQSQLEAQIRAEMSQRRQGGTTSSRNAPFWLQARTQENETPLTDAFYQWWRTYGTQYETQSEALRAYTDFMARVGLN